MSIVVIIAALVVLMVLTLKKIPVPVAVLISVAIMAIFTGSNILTTISDGYMSSVAAFIKANWMLLLTGVTLSKVMDMTGAASSIAKVITKKLGAKRVIPAIMFSGAVLAYGGIDGLALSFALYPIALGMFREANIPRSFIPAALTSSLFTWVMCLPGAPVITNFNAAKALGTSGMAGALIGVVSAVVVIVLQLLYFNFALKKAAKNGEGFVSDEETQMVLARSDEMEKSGSLPNPILSLTPIVVVVVGYNVFKLELWVAMLLGSVLCLAVLFKTIKGFGEVRDMVFGATTQAAIITITAGTVVGIGGVISAIPGFNDMINTIISIGHSGGNPLVLWSSATVILSGLLTNGMVGLLTALQTLSKTFLGLGVAPEALHRIGVIACAVLDCMPYGGGVVAIFTLTKTSYKEGYKHVAITAVIPMFIALVVAVTLGSVMYK